MLSVKPRAKNPSGSHPENKSDVTVRKKTFVITKLRTRNLWFNHIFQVVNHQQDQFFRIAHQKVKSIQSVLPNVQMETKVNGEQDAARKKANTFGIQSLPKLKPLVIKPSDWPRDLSGLFILIHINLRKPK